MQDYRVQLDIYQGPLDLLLYLIRREEVDIYDIPIARITDQFVQYVDLLRQIDPNVVGDFLVMAATLMEIKSRMLLPRPPAEEGGDEVVDPRLDLVRQLLEYKRYKDVAARLGEAARIRSMRYERTPAALPSDGVQIDLDEVQIWDLVAAFNNLMASIGRSTAAHEVVYDDTPISLHAADVQDRLEREGGSLPFDRIFEGRTKSEMIGLFLALLELIRQRRVRVEQDGPFGTIYVHLLDATPITETSIAEAAAESEAADGRATGPAEEAEDGESAPFAGVADFNEEDSDEFSRLIDQVKVDVPIAADLPVGDERSTASSDADKPAEADA